MKHILFITDTYYPDSSATTTLGRRTAEALARLGYNVDVYPAETAGLPNPYIAGLWPTNRPTATRAERD